MHLWDGMTREGFGENLKPLLAVREEVSFSCLGSPRTQATILVLSPNPGYVTASGQPVWRSAAFPALVLRHKAFQPANFDGHETERISHQNQTPPTTNQSNSRTCSVVRLYMPGLRPIWSKVLGSHQRRHDGAVGIGLWCVSNDSQCETTGSAGTPTIGRISG